ncbi:MAG: exo-alpha-sialidase [Phycisphaerales bacterium]|nr:exo-alpha-sialidase [Phycisphaerales bacterium]
MGTTAVIGTAKGGFILRSDDRRTWSVEGPLFKGWKLTTTSRTPAGTYLAATASDVYGTAVHRSRDLAEWEQVETGPAWPAAAEGGGNGEARKLKQIWTFGHGGNRTYAGVDDAGLFASDDDGVSWTPVDGLNEHSTRSGWFPGAGGLCAHAVLVDPADPKRLWCGISAVGVFRSDDGGASWTPKNEGIPIVIEDKSCKDIGRCVHGMVADPKDANTIYRREHVGVFRTRDGGEHWERIEHGLPSWFGFPIVMDVPTNTLFLAPLESDEYRMPVDGRLSVYRSRDGGDSWEDASAGLPAEHAYVGVLRGAMAADQDGGVYLGTTGGQVYVSSDGADSWQTLPVTLPRVLSVEVYPS